MSAALYRTKGGKINHVLPFFLIMPLILGILVPGCSSSILCPNLSIHIPNIAESPPVGTFKSAPFSSYYENSPSSVVSYSLPHSSHSSFSFKSSLNYTRHLVIDITSDDQLQAIAVSGSGTKLDPYVLEGWNITSLGTGISIQFTTRHFIIRKCWIDAEPYPDEINYGIFLSQIATGTATIINNICLNSHYGIYLGGTRNSIVANNTVINNIWDGIHLSLGARGNTIANNTISENSGRGIALWDSGNNRLFGNIITNNNRNGIELRNSGDNKIINNTLVNNALYLHIPHGSMEDYLQGSVENNTINGKPLVYWQSKVGGIIPPGVGQIILVNCTKMIIVGQTLSNIPMGVLAAYCSLLSIHNNTISNNNYAGIYLRNSENSTISENTIVNNYQDAIVLWSSDYNQISRNKISTNHGYGIYVWNSDSNLVFSNIFIGNQGESQARDDSFNNIFTFNYWSDWTSPDVDADGFVDQPYPIVGDANNYDFTPLAFFNSPDDHLLSSPRIVYPNGGETLNGILTIQWIRAVDSLNYPINYYLYYSANNGNTWTLLISNLTTTSYDWDTTIVADGSSYRIKVIAISFGGLTAQDISQEVIIQNYAEIRFLFFIILLSAIIIELSLLAGFIRYVRLKVIEKKQVESRKRATAQVLLFLQEFLDEKQ